MEIIARCDRCGKGFVYLNPEKEKAGVPCPYEYGKCGGTVRLLPKPRSRPTTGGGPPAAGR